MVKRLKKKKRIFTGMSSDIAAQPASSKFILPKPFVVTRGDLAKQHIQALACCIPPDLTIKGSLNTHLFERAGPKLDEMILEEIVAPRPGDVFSVPGFQLPAEHLFFAVMPFWRSDMDILDKHQVNAVRGIMEACHTHHISRIAFPLLNCGAKGYPLERGVRLLIQGIFDRFFTGIEEVRIICPSERAEQVVVERLRTKCGSVS
jgi:O-acetyl-ADP-ribose deacetylase (regulator of RNase III)